MTKTKALYGFSPGLSPFAGKGPAEQVALLRSWGNTAIFGGYEDADFVDAAHGAGLAVFAEFGCFVGRQLWDRYLDSRPITVDGSPLEPDGPYWGVNPAIPAVRKDRLRALERLLTDYDVDGVWLDFIRWPCHWEVLSPELTQTSFDAQTLARFVDDTATSLPRGDASKIAAAVLEQHGDAWAAWRRDQITSWVAEARETVNRVRPDALLALFGVPWRLADYGGAILSLIGQDYRGLGCYIDVFSPMVYHAMCGFDVAWIGQVTEEVQALSGKPVWPIVQSVDDPRALTADEYGSAIDVVLKSPASEGVLVFTLEGALVPGRLAATKARFTEIGR